MKQLGLFYAFIFSISSSQAQPISDIPKIGPHHRVFTYEKNENNQNIMIAYTKLDSDCRIQRNNGKPLLDFYWLMNRESYKPVAPLIKKRIRQKIQIQNSIDPFVFEIRLMELKELVTDLKSTRLLVESKKLENGQCLVQTTIPSSLKGHKDFQLKTIYAEVQKTWNPFDRKVVSISLKGTDAKTGEDVSREFKTQKGD
jgi:hypothetical protein